MVVLAFFNYLGGKVKPEDRRRLKRHIEMIIEHNTPSNGVFCPACECDRETRLYAEVMECTVCHETFEVVCGIKPSNSDVSMTQDVLIDVKTGQSVEKVECSWIQEDDPDICYWKTGCGNSFYFTEGTPTDNNMKYCCYCGKLLKQED
jgi:ribosomal protein L37AE/L43A